MQRLAGMNPLLQAGSAIPVPSPRARSSVEEELALQALQNLKNDPLSSDSEMDISPPSAEASSRARSAHPSAS